MATGHSDGARSPEQAPIRTSFHLASDAEAVLLDLERRIALQKPLSGPEFWNAETRARCLGLDVALKVVRERRLAAVAEESGNLAEFRPVDQRKAVAALARLLKDVLERTADAWAAGEDDTPIDQALHLARVLVKETGEISTLEIKQ